MLRYTALSIFYIYNINFLEVLFCYKFKFPSIFPPAGAGIFGHLSDSFLGRKGALTLTSSINAVFGLATAFSPSFPFYAALRFVTGLSTGGLGVSVFILTTEPVGPSARSPVAMCTFLFFA